MHQDPLLRHGFDSIPPLGPEKLFNASSAMQWDSLRSSFPLDQAKSSTSESANENPEFNSSAFMAYSSLECINALTCRRRKFSVLDDTSLSQLEDGLLAWCKKYQALWKRPQKEPFQMRILLCSNYLALLVNLDMLERAVGRDGPETAERASTVAKAWAASPQALRCLMYANVILKEIGETRIGDEAAIHSPRAAFQAGLIFLGYASFGFEAQDVNATSELEAMLDETFVYTAEHVEACTLSQPITARAKLRLTIDALERVGRCGLASRLATLLNYLAESEDACL